MTPKSSMENPPLRVSGHVSSMNRTFIVEDYAEDDFGQRARDEVTGEQGYIDDERSCFWTWDDTECAWQSRPFKGHPVKKEEKEREKGKAEDDPKGPEEHSLAMNMCVESDWPARHSTPVSRGAARVTSGHSPRCRRG